MTEDELIYRLQYLSPTDIWERQQLLHEYCYKNNIDLGYIHDKPLKIYMIG